MAGLTPGEFVLTAPGTKNPSQADGTLDNPASIYNRFRYGVYSLLVCVLEGPVVLCPRLANRSLERCRLKIELRCQPRCKLLRRTPVEIE